MIIYKNSNGDTRTAKKDVTYKEFMQANDMHIEDVRNLMMIVSTIISNRAMEHDYTKKEYEELFYHDFKETLINGTDFVTNKWYQIHISEERHHLTSRCPNDVTLIDVIEMLCDCVCAGMARSGEVRQPEITQEILNTALNNTTDLLKSMISVREVENNAGNSMDR